MTGRELHRLIHSLDRRDKVNFIKFTDSKSPTNQGSRRPKFLRLFDRMMEKAVYNESRIRGDLFGSPVKYYQAREKLLDKIIQSQVFFSEAKLSARSYINHALKVDAFELAQKRLIAEMELAQSARDDDYFIYLNSLKEKIENNYQISISLPEGLQETDLPRNYPFVLQLRMLLRDVERLIRKVNAYAGALGPRQFLQQLQQIPIKGSEALYLNHKIRCYVALLQSDYAQAFVHQQSSISALMEAPLSLQKGLVAKEYFLLVQFASLEDQTGVAVETVFKFSQIETENQKEADIKEEYWMRAAIMAASDQGNLSLIQPLMPILIDSEAVFTKEVYLLNLFRVAMVFFVHGDLDQAQELLDLIRTKKKCKWREIYWATETFRLMVHYEKGNSELIDSISRSADRLAKSLELSYPVSLTRIVKKLTHSSRASDWEPVYENFLSEKDGLRAHPKEKVAIDLFDPHFWFASKSAGTPLLEAFRNTPDQENNTQKNSAV